MDRKKCPYCGEEIAATAKKCRFCGEWIADNNAPAQPSQQPTAQPAQQSPAQPAQPVSRQPMQQPTSSQSNNNPGNTQIAANKPAFFEAYFVDPYFRHYADFAGRASRKQFWMTYLANLIVSAIVTGIILILISLIGMPGGLIAGCVLGGLFSLALFIPQLAICVRRLRDAGKSPYSIFLGLIPAVGSIILLIFFCQPTFYTDPETNEIDTEPKNIETKFAPIDWCMIAAAVVLPIVGIILMITSVASAFSGSDYDLGDMEDVALVDDDEDVEIVEETPVDEYEYSDRYAERSMQPIEISSPNTFQGYNHEFQGAINGKYKVNMHLDLENYTGSYYYLTSAGNGSLDLEISSFDPDSRAIEIIETNDKGERTGFFDGYLTRSGLLHGTFTNYQGKEMPFRLEVNDAP